MPAVEGAPCAASADVPAVEGEARRHRKLPRVLAEPVPEGRQRLVTDDEVVDYRVGPFADPAELRIHEAESAVCGGVRVRPQDELAARPGCEVADAVGPVERGRRAAGLDAVDVNPARVTGAAWGAQRGRGVRSLESGIPSGQRWSIGRTRNPIINMVNIPRAISILIYRPPSTRRPFNIYGRTAGFNVKGFAVGRSAYLILSVGVRGARAGNGIVAAARLVPR